LANNTQRYKKQAKFRLEVLKTKGEINDFDEMNNEVNLTMN